MILSRDKGFSCPYIHQTFSGHNKIHFPQIIYIYIYSFDRLAKSVILSCPKKLRNYLPSLTKLFVGNCRKLEFTLLRLPSLKKLTVDECNETVLNSGIELTSLTELRVSGILELIKLQQGFVRSLGRLQALKFSECEELTCLWKDGFESKSLHCHQLVPSGCNLRSLKISSCDKLERLPNGWQRSNMP